MTRLIIDGNAVYEIDEECMEEQKKNRSKSRVRAQERKDSPSKEHGRKAK